MFRFARMKKQASEAEQLRSEIDERRSNRGPLRRTVRERGIAFARMRMQEGASAETIAAELGLSAKTIERWLEPEAPKARAAMVPVRIVRSPSASPPRPEGVVVTTASGLRIVGLDIDALCTLVARCG